MSLVQELRIQLENAQREKKQTEQDLVEMANAVIDVMQELGLDPFSTDFSKLSLGSLLPKVTMKAMSGKLKFEKLGTALPTLKKYEHLIRK